MRIFVDRSSVEVFGNDGKQVITDIILPDRSSKGLELYAAIGGVKVKSLTIHPLKKVWRTSPFMSNLTGWTTVNGTWPTQLRGNKGGRTVIPLSCLQHPGQTSLMNLISPLRMETEEGQEH